MIATTRPAESTRPSIDGYLADVRARVDRQLAALAEVERAGPAPRFAEAVGYALAGPGKRLRPALVLAACEALGGDPSDGGLAMRFAVSLELVHTYSLVHDDLPSMDDDDLRRGRLTVHRAFEEATAVLVGDGLQALAFRHLLAAPAAERGRAAQLGALLADAAYRMVQGQSLDLAAEGHALDEAAILALMAHKTGALLEAAVTGGAIAAVGEARGLERAGRELGLAFQIADDLLDLSADAATLGKASGKDAAAGKATLPSLLGTAPARARAVLALDRALDHFSSIGPAAAHLCDLARYVLSRER